MATWAALLMETPRNTPAGTTGIITPLSLASGLAPSFTVDDIDTISFSLPGGHYHSALVVAGATDVILTRDEKVVQRYRVVSKSISAQGGQTTVQVTASDYREVVNNWILHDGTVSPDPLDYPFTTGESADEVAWLILNRAQSRSTERDIRLTRGLLPTIGLPDHLGYVNDDTTSTFFTGGQSIKEAVDTILHVDDGCDWSIEPNPADPYGALVFNTWNRGQRHNPAFPGGLSTLLLSTGSMASFSTDQVPHKNVLRASGLTDDTGPSVVRWAPAGENPTEFTEAGAWEATVSTDQPNYDQVEKFLAEQYDLAVTGQGNWQVTLHPREWLGPDDLWIGDSARLVVQLGTVDDGGDPTDDLLLDVDDVMRVVRLTVTISGAGETLSLELNRPSVSLLDEIYQLRTDLAAQRRRT